MLALRYFPLPGSLSSTPGSIDLVGDRYLTLWHRPRCRELPQPRLPRPRRRPRIPAGTSLRLLALTLWWPAPAVTCEKRLRYSISSAIPACRLAFLLVVEL